MFRWLWVGLLGCASLVWAAPQSRDRALRDLQSARFADRVSALEALSTVKEPAVVDAVVQVLADKDPTVRWAAVEALEKLGDTRAVPALQKAARDPAPLVAQRAQAAVAALSHTDNAAAGPPAVHVVGAAGDVPEANAHAPLMQKNAAAALKARGGTGVRLLDRETEDPHYLMTVSVRSAVQRREGTQSVLEVTCTAVLMELPGHQLRFATRVGAALGTEGEMTATDRADLLRDAVDAASTALGEETADYLRQHHPQ